VRFLPRGHKEIKSVEFSKKELVLIYMFLKQKTPPDQLQGALLIGKIEKWLFDFLTIDQIENIEEYYKSL
jgi:hypothetical protein